MKFTNITLITDKNFRSAMLVKKLLYDRKVFFIKLLSCLFIFIAVNFCELSILFKIFSVCFAVLGIIDAFIIKENRQEGITTMKYIFYDNYFLVSNLIETIDIDYSYLKRIFETKNYFYVLAYDIVFIIDKKKFDESTLAAFTVFLKSKMKCKKI